MKIKTIILMICIIYLSGCATSAVRFGTEKQEFPVYPATQFDADMISFIFLAFTSEETSPESVHLKSFGCILGPLLFVAGLVDLPISLVTDTVMYPSDLHKRKLKEVDNNLSSP